MSEPLLDTDRLVAGLRFRRWFWAACALLGLVAGVLLTVLTPTTSTAVARVLITRTDDQLADRKTLMETDVALFETTESAADALRRLGVDEPEATFLGSFRGEGLTPNVLQITAHGTSGGDAVRRAQALADVFIASHVGRAREVAEEQAGSLLERRSQVEQAVQDVSGTIFETTAKGAGAVPGSRESADVSAQLDSLFARRSGLASQVLDLDARAAEGRLAAAKVEAGTRLVDPPRVIPTSPTSTAVAGGGGLAIGLGVGLALAAVLALSRDRPALRRDIADGLGVSVIAQLPASRSGLLGFGRGRRARERARVAVALAGVIQGAPASVSVLEIGCRRAAAELALELAAQIAGRRTVVVVDDLHSRQLRRASRRRGRPTTVVSRVDLPLDRGSPTPHRRLCLGVGSITPGSSWVDLRELGTEALLVVRAGRATATWLHTVARQLDHAGICPIGVVLVAPHPRDRSDGTLWHALHTALNDRRTAPQPSPVARQERRYEAVPAGTVHTGPSPTHE